MAECNHWATRATCYRPGICTPCSRFRDIVQIGIAPEIEGRYRTPNMWRWRRAHIARRWMRHGPAPRFPRVQPKNCNCKQVTRAGRSAFSDRHESPGRGAGPRAAALRSLDWGGGGDGGGAVVIEPSAAHELAPLKAGHGIVFDAADCRSPQEPEEGGWVYRVVAGKGGDLQADFANGAVNLLNSGVATWCGGRTIRNSIEWYGCFWICLRL